MYDAKTKPLSEIGYAVVYGVGYARRRRRCEHLYFCVQVLVALQYCIRTDASHTAYPSPSPDAHLLKNVTTRRDDADRKIGDWLAW